MLNVMALQSDDQLLVRECMDQRGALEQTLMIVRKTRVLSKKGDITNDIIRRLEASVAVIDKRIAGLLKD